ncbi:peptidase M48 [Scytonema sp. HK-05]|uniref:M48 family metallopeptidase n=1 Tax=Scytonema sp. HK-05 TaxID=1137095 RepID=UPI000935E1D4|nr:M48 family metallopeptidase [Scytonema sp. HK-05]OKH59763.1 peptidase M48 Ste24p [Scytonema sp. HK-05]BAY47818.1 peptidase M48 [Scytonema sp. HK-05]
MKSRFSKLRKSLAFFLAGLGTSVGVGLVTPTPASALPWGQLLFNGVQLLQLSNLSTQQKVELGQEIHQQVRSNYRLSTNEKVTRVGQRVAAASDCSQYPFHFYVVQDSSINAFSTTGGYVYVHTGLLNAVDNEDQLAAVLGHEIGHICNNDLVNKLRQAQLAQGAASVAGLDRSTVAAAAYKLAVDLPNSRDAEYNADEKGLRYIQRAGYNPNAMPAFLSKLVNQRSTPSFLSDHPGARERISVLQRKIAAGR